MYVATNGSKHATPPNQVQTLLLATKELCDILVRWSEGTASETAVSDIYVRIGTEFNATVIVLGQYGIDISEIHSVPDELRIVLEQCLGEEPSKAAVEQFMPGVRSVLYKMLLGLKAKQPSWKARTR